MMSVQTVPTKPPADTTGAADSDPVPDPVPHEVAKRRYWGYLARIIFVVFVAICFSKRDEIGSSVSWILGRQPTGSNEDPDINQLKAPPNRPDMGPVPDYFNPPFDPENPPEPMYSKSGTRLITWNELAAHGHSGPLKPIWLAMTGKVFDVSKGEEHYYGANGGYKFFTGTDGTKAFVTGEFNEEGLTDDLSELTPLELDEVENWVQFYAKDYTYVGKLIGRYYMRDGNPTKEWYNYQRRLGEKDLIKAEMKKMEIKFPGCNSHWTEATQGKVYCSEKSGGVSRNWVGYPRRFFAPGTKGWRCACVNKEDLDSPHVKLYPDCDPNSRECKVDPEKIKELRKQGL